ncbi:class E sortase [Corynebacterium tapiri]|uniref:Class E sortase n=1 Tax=Corynebacterium tapiri TaxID=1448266 RepID=A0A5C4U1H8_9CORY|nr:class E sortase [Corynebacterium tapiri]
MAGELFVTLGVLLLLFAFYEAFWTNVRSGQLQDQANHALQESWDSGQRINPRTYKNGAQGAAFARLHIPAYGSDWNFAVMHGVDDTTLLSGPGHYEQTQGPGQAGNFALAGHRVGKGAPFNDLGKLEACDAIVIETASEWITYRVMPMSQDAAARQQQSHCLSPEQAQRVATGDYAHVLGRHITLPGDVGVIAPLPGTELGVSQDLEGVLTLTTCHPQFSNAERMIVHAMKVAVEPKSEGQRPAVLKES